MQTVLVTGGAGFLGQEVIRALLATGRPVVATWYSKPPVAGESRVVWRRADLTTAGALDALPQVNAVCHLAATLPSAGTSQERAAGHNRQIDENLIAFSRERGLPTVYASGTMVYGLSDAEDVPVTEERTPEPPGPYLAEKVWAEQQGRAQLNAFSVLRICAPYGPRQAARSVLPIFLERALRKEPLLYHGTGSREQTFTFSSDIGNAFVRALEGPPGTYNIAGPSPITMRELARMIARSAGLEETYARPSGQTDAQEGVLARFDTGLARRALGWRPEVELELGLARCLEVNFT